VIAEHPDIPAVRVGSVVRREWMVDVNTVDHVPTGSSGWHWVLGDDDGPRWFASLQAVHTPAARACRLAAFESAAQVAQQLPFAVAPVHTRDARIAVDLAAGLILTLAPYVEHETVPGAAGAPDADGEPPERDAAEAAGEAGEVDRCVVAGLLGELHRLPRPRQLPTWEPRLGRHDGTLRDDLEQALGQDQWSGGPWSGPASRLVADARPVLRQSLRRFTLLGAAVVGSADRWVVTHGQPHPRHLVPTADGPRLLDWGMLALAPRERDLRAVLQGADGDGPWYAYLEAGGRPEALSPDTVDLFVLQAQLTAVGEAAVRLSRPHGDGEDERRRFGSLEHGLGALVERWA
jgi:spectinomycin phosphotransferase